MAKIAGGGPRKKLHLAGQILCICCISFFLALCSCVRATGSLVLHWIGNMSVSKCPGGGVIDVT